MMSMEEEGNPQIQQQSKDELPLPKATDISLLNSQNRTTLKSFEHNGHIWEFEIREDISTQEFNDILKSYYELAPNKQDVITNLERYDRKKLKAFIAKAPFDVTEQEIIRLQHEHGGFVRKILALIPYDPMDVSLPDESKKKLRQLFGLERI